MYIHHTVQVKSSNESAIINHLKHNIAILHLHLHAAQAKQKQKQYTRKKIASKLSLIANSQNGRGGTKNFSFPCLSSSHLFCRALTTSTLAGWLAAAPSKCPCARSTDPPTDRTKIWGIKQAHTFATYPLILSRSSASFFLLLFPVPFLLSCLPPPHCPSPDPNFISPPFLAHIPPATHPPNHDFNSHMPYQIRPGLIWMEATSIRQTLGFVSNHHT